jgi:peptidylprolyl isomerase
VKNLLLCLAVTLGLVASSAAFAAASPEDTLNLDTQYGRVVIEMRPDLAPKHVARIKELVRKGFYDGLTFHRVIKGFMAQGGDPDGNGTGGSGQTIPAEFSSEPFKRGVVGMARSSDPNSGDSQFFIMFEDGFFLNGQYTVWGVVTSGMEFIDKLAVGEPPANPDKIIKMQIAADVAAEAPAAEAPAAAVPAAEAPAPDTTAPAAPETPAPAAEAPAAEAPAEAAPETAPAPAPAPVQ